MLGGQLGLRYSKNIWKCFYFSSTLVVNFQVWTDSAKTSSECWVLNRASTGDCVGNLWAPVFYWYDPLLFLRNVSLLYLSSAFYLQCFQLGWVSLSIKWARQLEDFKNMSKLEEPKSPTNIALGTFLQISALYSL